MEQERSSYVRTNTTAVEIRVFFYFFINIFKRYNRLVTHWELHGTRAQQLCKNQYHCGGSSSIFYFFINIFKRYNRLVTHWELHVTRAQQLCKNQYHCGGNSSIFYFFINIFKRYNRLVTHWELHVTRAQRVCSRAENSSILKAIDQCRRDELFGRRKKKKKRKSDVCVRFDLLDICISIFFFFFFKWLNETYIWKELWNVHLLTSLIELRWPRAVVRTLKSNY